MFEGIIFGFIAFAIGYVTLMRLMARRADVLHGEFIQPNEPRRPAAPTLLASIQRYVRGFRLPARR